MSSNQPSLGSLFFISIFAAACGSGPDDDGQEIPPLVAEAIAALPRAIVDLGSGPEEIVYQDIDGLAVLEGDMILGPTEVVASGNFVLNPLPEVDTVKTLSVFNYGGWPGGEIPFVNGPNLVGTAPGAITAAISTWNATGIVRFVPRTNQNTWIVFDGATADMGRGEGRAPIGFIPYTVRVVRFGDRVSPAIAHHELGHVIGLRHEHTRLDRYNAVSINWANVRLDRVGNYLTHGPEATDYDPYDISSLMHYDNNTFSINFGVPDMVPVGCPFTSPIAPNCRISPSSVPTVGLTGPAPGTNRVTQEQCTRAADQFFDFVPSSGGYQIRARGTNQCLRKMPSTSEVILSSTCSSASTQRRWFTAY